MAILNLEQALIQAAQCVRKYKHNVTTTEIKIYSGYVDVYFRTSAVVREFPKDGNDLRVWADGQNVVVAVSFNFEEEEG